MTHMPTTSSPSASSASQPSVSLVNATGGTVLACSPVYSSSSSSFNLTSLSSTATKDVIGLAMTAVPVGVAGLIQTDGVVLADSAAWDAICGTSGGLTFGTRYYLSTASAGRLSTSSASAIPVIFGLGPTIGRLIIGSLPGVTDDGSIVALTTRKFQIGTDAVNAGQAVMITEAASATTTQVWIEQHDTGHQGDTTGLLGGCEAINLVLRQNAGFNTTASAAPANASCIDLAVTASRTSGTQPLTNTGILIQSVNGDTNYAINILSGTLKSVAPVVFSGSVNLGNNVQNFEVPGDTSTVARIGIGGLPSVDGTGLQVKNTVPGSSLTGCEVGLDTTVNAGIRGGYLIFRGAGGNFGGNSAGMVIAGGAGFPFGSSAANELAIFSENSTPLTFGADSSGFTKGMTLETNNQLRVASTIQVGSLNASGGHIICGVERLSAAGAASVALETTYVSGAGSNLTLAAGNVDGQTRTFIATAGTGQVTPSSFGNGTKMTWSAGAQSCTMRWDATGTKWWLVSNVGMTVV